MAEFQSEQRLGVSFVCCSIILALSALVIGLFLALSGSTDSLVTAYDAERTRLSRDLKSALSAYMLEQWELTSSLSEGKEHAQPICREGVLTKDDPDCLSLDVLIGQYIGCLPQDGGETIETRTGFIVYLEGGLPRVSSAYMGQKKQVHSKCD